MAKTWFAWVCELQCAIFLSPAKTDASVVHQKFNTNVERNHRDLCSVRLVSKKSSDSVTNAQEWMSLLNIMKLVKDFCSGFKLAGVEHFGINQHRGYDGNKACAMLVSGKIPQAEAPVAEVTDE